MDDILCFYAKSPEWKYDEFVNDFCKSEVYIEPLKLEDGKDATFLETRFEIEEDKINFWLKNENETEKRYGGIIIFKVTALSNKKGRR